jgi:hypothetical protein
MEKHLEQITKIISQFLLRFGGMKNGFDTYAEGSVHLNVSGGLKIMTPACRDKSFRQVDTLSTELEQKIQHYMKANQINQPVYVTSRHQEYGIYETEVWFKTTKTLLL